jgi:hypothetical protein
MKWFCTLAAVASLGLGCASGNSSAGSEQVNDACPATPQSLTGVGESGSSCTSYLDCAPVCCTCSNGDGDSFLASECNGGGDCDPAVACADAQDSQLCP